MELDEELQGMLAIPRTQCPHLEQVSLPPPGKLDITSKCSACEETEVWYCAHCQVQLCSRYKNACMAAHAKKELHPLALSYSDLSVWCSDCDAYLDVYAIEALHPLYSAAHEAKFGYKPPLPVISLEIGGNSSSSASGSGAGASGSGGNASSSSTGP
mmetsp:Transcript_63919/g.152451  ORF Transcript_63919/g.152451 Transcript_63919/m.152451 type:complete len:157 (+) Transcript_63919:84-554(+)